MLRQVPIAINNAARIVTLRHPNSMDCFAFRRQILRTETDPVTGLPSSASSMPTLGGMTVISADDEPQFDYAPLGAGKCLFTVGIYAGQTMNERQDALAQDNITPAQIEPIANDGPEHFQLIKGDLIALMPGLGVVLAYSVEDVTAGTMIPGFVSTVMLQPRDDLHSLVPYLPGAFAVTA
jgi:hypothetical protein